KEHFSVSLEKKINDAIIQENRNEFLKDIQANISKLEIEKDFSVKSKNLKEYEQIQESLRILKLKKEKLENALSVANDTTTQKQIKELDNHISMLSNQAYILFESSPENIIKTSKETLKLGDDLFLDSKNGKKILRTSEGIILNKNSIGKTQSIKDTLALAKIYNKDLNLNDLYEIHKNKDMHEIWDMPIFYINKEIAPFVSYTHNIHQALLNKNFFFFDKIEPLNLSASSEEKLDYFRRIWRLISESFKANNSPSGLLWNNAHTPDFKNLKGKKAIKFLNEVQTGYIQNAFHKEGLGDIDLVWGKAGSGRSDEYGLAKIMKYHPEVVSEIPQIIQEGKILKDDKGRLNIEYG
ncbi:hypothetical protein CCZ01_09795, partial [Helicobacter monodelphidis]